MMKIKQFTIWSTLFALFLLNQYVEKFLGIQIPYIHSYFDDLLAVPVTLGAFQLWKEYRSKQSTSSLSWVNILVCIIAFSFHFEVLMPALSHNYTGDILDVLMYFIGGVFYWFVLNEGSSKSKPLNLTKRLLYIGQ